MNPGKYIYPVKTSEIKSEKNITVFVKRKIRIYSKGDKLTAGDTVKIKNLRRIDDYFYSGNIIYIKSVKKNCFQDS